MALHSAMVLVTFALLALFVHYDANHPMYVWRATFPQGTWLNLVLPFAWCFLAAQAILQDSLVGDGQFWVALPCNWRTLLLAKITFVVSTIAVPYLVATSAILIARGFEFAAALLVLGFGVALLVGSGAAA